MTDDQPGDTGIDAGTFRLRDLEFEIDSASIEEDLSESKPRWTLYIGTKERSLFDFRWAPNIRGEDVLVDAPPFSEIVGSTVKVPLAYDHDTDEYLFSMYVFQHDDVFDSSITFLERKDGKFLIHWKGLCHVNWGEEYRRDVPFEFKTWFDIDNSEQDGAGQPATRAESK